MTISSTVRKAGPFIGDGIVTAFPFAFKVFATSELEVVTINLITNTQTTLVLNVNYTATLNPDQNSNPGGTVTKLTPLAVSNNLIITSNVFDLQETDLQNQGGFYPEVITDALDKLTILVQQLRLNTDATLFFPITDTSLVSGELPSAAVRAGKVLSFNSLGAPVTIVSSVDVAAVAAIAAQIVICAANVGAIVSCAANVAAIVTCATNIAAIIAAPAQTAANAAAAAASAVAANNSAIAANLSAIAAAAAVAAANIPTNLVGHAFQFLQVRADELGYDLVSSVAAPTFFGFTLDATFSVLTLTYGTTSVDVGNFLTWTMSENITFAVQNNQLAMVL